MELIDNENKILLEDLSAEIKKGSKLSIAAACFSIYAFQALKDRLINIEELRFIFTVPTFSAEKEKKRSGNSIFPAYPANAICMAQSLRSNCAMN